jgi:hypothetical protein
LNTIYTAKFLSPRIIFTALKLVSFVEAPDMAKEMTAPGLIPISSQAFIRGIVPPPHIYTGTPRVAANKTPSFSVDNLLFHKLFV